MGLNMLISKCELGTLIIFFPGVEYDHVYEANKNLKFRKFSYKKKKTNNQM